MGYQGYKVVALARDLSCSVHVPLAVVFDAPAVERAQPADLLGWLGGDGPDAARSTEREPPTYSDRQLLEVSVASGFISTSHFAQWFRRFHGVRP